MLTNVPNSSQAEGDPSGPPITICSSRPQSKVKALNSPAKNSFVFNGAPYSVPCCMQIWSKVAPKGYDDLRIRTRPPTKHDDFEMFLTCDNVPKLPLVREQIKNQEYWEFGLKYWGQIRVCEYSEIAPETTTHYLFKSKKPYVREIFEQIEWSRYVSNMGAPNVGGKSLVIKAYTEKKRELGIKD